MLETDTTSPASPINRLLGVMARLRNPDGGCEWDLAQDFSTIAHRHEEVGDLLFAVANYARKLGVDPEAALRDANAKFARRFAAMEAIAGGSLQGLSLDEQEAHWQTVKVAERS